MKTYPKAVCIVIERPSDGKYLCGSRRGTTDAWGLIGGKVDEGETFLESVLRETLEETGLRIDPMDVIPTYRGLCGPGKDGRIFDCVAYHFIGDVSKLEPKSMEDGILVDWVSEEELMKGPFADYNRELFKQ